MIDRETKVIVAIFIAAVVLSGLLGFYISTIAGSSQTSNAVTQQQQQQAAGDNAKNQTVTLDIIPDWGGAGYDAFVLAQDISNSPPAPATNTTQPGPNDNNITVGSAGTTVKFIIVSTDTAVLENFSNIVTTPFVVYNDTASGQVAEAFGTGQSNSNMSIGHTFSIGPLNTHIPIPPDTQVTFSMTFSAPGIYEYFCETPCGPGMNLPGYMSGFIIVK